MSDVSMDSDSDDGRYPSTSSGSAVMRKERSNHRIHTGKIVRLELTNFLTHSEATVLPDENLNIVIGPNGTGKSSIVAAVVIGLGGSTKILSQRNRLSDYVKNGKDRAKINVVLYRDERRNRMTFGREFGRNNKSTFTIDGKKVAEKDFQEQIQKLNIQVGNLCQFLPQERVQDFAKQNPKELFESTCSSVCDDEMMALFNELKAKRDRQLNGDKTLKDKVTLLQNHKQRVELLQSSVDEIRRRDEILKRVDLLKKKIAWVKFEQLFLKCKEIDKELKLAEKTHKEWETKRDDLVKSVDEIAKNRKQLEGKLANETKAKDKYENDLDNVRNDIEKLQSELNRALSDLESAKQSASERLTVIEENQMVLNTFQTEYEEFLASIGSVEQVNENIKAIEESIDKLRENITRLSEGHSKLLQEIEHVVRPNMVMVDNKIKSLQSIASAKLDFVKRNIPDCYKAIMWLRENQNLFQGQIYEPMLLTINVRNQEYTKFIESCVAVRDLEAFVCEEVDDMNLLLQKLRIEQKLKINVIHSDASAGLNYKSSVPLAEVRRFGGEIYMIDCLEAPIPILNYLCKIYQMHNVLIGNENLELKYEHLPNVLQLFFTPTHRVQMKTSKYSGQKSLMSTPLTIKNILAVRVSQKDLQIAQNQKEVLTRQLDELNNKRHPIETKMKDLEDARKEKNKQKVDQGKQITQLNALKTKVKQQTDKIRRLEANTVDLDRENEKFQTTSKQLTKQMAKCSEKAILLYEQLIKAGLNEVKARARLTIFRNSNADYDVQIAELTDEVDRAKSYCDRIGTALNAEKQKCKNQQIEAMKLTDNKKPSDGARFPFKAQFDELSNDVAQLNEELDDLEAQGNCNTADNQQILEEYNERLANIESLEEEIADGNRSSGSLERDISQQHYKWYPKILSMINTINENFSSFMESMSCAGEVGLIRNSERDYDSYGIEIRVKYRANEQLRPLDRFVQSGGERAVAIAVYSLSLQHLSQVPFRCVDELNQGMDPNNERRIFEMLVNIVAQQNQSQFFYVTPKLLSDLSYNELVTCITVCNGPLAEAVDHFGQRSY